MSDSRPTEVSVGPLVSVIIPAHNAEATLQRCLESFTASSATPLETIVVCDDCSDRTSEIAQGFAGVRVIHNDRQRGAAYSRNVGAVAARGEIFFFVDADCVLQPNTIERGLKALATGEKVIFGAYIPETSTPGFWTRFKNYQHHYTHQHGADYQTSFWSGCGAIVRQSFEELEGFDVSVMACEDIEFGYALTRRGYRIRIVKDMQVEHLKPYTLTRLLRSDLLHRAIPWTRLVRAGRAELGKLNTGRSGRRSVVLTAGVLLGLPLAPMSGWALTAGLLSLAGLIGFNAGLLGFIRSRRGWLFAAGSTGALLVHYSICGLGYAIGLASPRLPHERSPAPQYAGVEQTPAPNSIPAAAKGS